MTVKELISVLSNFSDCLEVIVSGYESGFNSIDVVGCMITKKEKGDWYDGEYQYVYNGEVGVTRVYIGNLECGHGEDDKFINKKGVKNK